jgi:hypothetical protein
VRSDESAARMKTDREALRGYLDSLAVGTRIPIDEWYKVAQRLGLGRSDRQRLSDMRQEGYDFAFDFKAKEYEYRGWNGDSQPTLF